MKVAAFEGIVENGRIRLPDTVRLPEKAKVYVVLPGAEAPPAFYVGSPRIAHPERAADFVKEVTEDARMPAYDDALFSPPAHRPQR